MLTFQEIEFADRQTYTLSVDGVPFASFVSSSAMGDYIGTTYGEGVVVAARGTCFRYDVRPLGGNHYVLDLIESNVGELKTPPAWFGDLPLH
jgi:hypothetical protein